MSKEPAFTPEQLAEYREAFNIFDRDGDGHITAKELSTVLRSLGQNPSSTEIDEMMKEIDTSGNGTIEFEEFIAIMDKQVHQGDVEEEILDAFRAFDKDQDGKIAASELSHILKNIGEPLSQEEVHEMIAQADLHKDGIIDYVEYVHLMLSS
ncbi:Calmodulin [Tritrichomonas foetus]|uniref:Calmodulin n=1 Tax=Tritrichomonas foetus TaxID=1144522 RepID=A0A1J4KUC3_9EUKA|nr:Calmodulin [Tritrichomonas foetus]|eukprot:OHT13262.1 Calmodulin [Tritrichomonas foetus]